MRLRFGCRTLPVFGRVRILNCDLSKSGEVIYAKETKTRTLENHKGAAPKFRAVIDSNG